MNESTGLRFTWADFPALLLAGVSAITVTTGAQLIRGQHRAVMLALGIGVAGATIVLDKLLVERLNSVTPRQNLPSLLLCWLSLFLFATTLATFATFSWIAPEVVRRDLDESRRLHWTREAEKVSTYLMSLRRELRRQVEAANVGIDTERRRASAARIEAAPYSPEHLRSFQRTAAAARDLDRRIPAIQTLPLDLPDEKTAVTQRDRAFRDLADIHASALLVLKDPPVLPTHDPFIAPSTDLQSVIAEETRKRTWRAVTAWGAALWVELLPLLALWRGGRKVSLASRIFQWRSRARETFDAITGRRAPGPLPIVIEPLQVRGVVRVALPSEYTLPDCAPFLDEAIRTLTGLFGSYQLIRVSNTRGDNLDEHLPLLPQLNGEPLVLSVIEGNP
jgi:hypothetical protein